ncbi:MAG: hypothetical protein AAF799_06980 [Myxococcota bacterium]
MNMNVMMKLSAVLVLVSALGLGVSCTEDSGDDATGMDDEGGEDFMCDPVGANAEMGALLNAPVADDVEVIVKQAQHPGNPGPLDLP